jgi:MerR family transcriptional regulator, light-induced transcriptional regulator
MSGINQHTSQHDTFLHALLAGDRAAGSTVVQELMKQDVSIKDIYEIYIKSALYRVGELWEQNKITVAEEHLATSVSEAIMNELFAGLISGKRTNKKVMVACIENEHHQVGAKMVADIFEKNGWDSYFLGANTPVNEIISFAKTLQPSIFAISVSIYFHLPLLESLLTRVHASFTHTPVIVGGQAFRHGGTDILEKYPNTLHIQDLYALESFIYSQHELNHEKII